MQNFNGFLFIYVFALRIISSLLSIAGAYLYVFDFLNATISISVISYFLTAFFLTFIELGSIVFLISFFRLFKNIKKKRTEIIITILFFVLALSFLSLSFFLTTKGASKWVVVQNEKTIIGDKSELLPEHESSFKYADQSKRASLIFDSLSNVPAHRYKTVRLQQINKLEYYKNQVDYYQKLMQDEREEFRSNILKEEKMNNSFIQEYSDKYYGFAVIIMVLVFISNFLMFYLNDLKNNAFTNYKSENIHEYNICKSSTCTNQVEDILKSDLSKTEKINALFNAKYSQKQIAEYLNISQSTVSRSLNGII